MSRKEIVSRLEEAEKNLTWSEREELLNKYWKDKNGERILSLCENIPPSQQDYVVYWQRNHFWEENILLHKEIRKVCLEDIEWFLSFWEIYKDLTVVLTCLSTCKTGKEALEYIKKLTANMPKFWDAVKIVWDVNELTGRVRDDCRKCKVKLNPLYKGAVTRAGKSSSKAKKL